MIAFLALSDKQEADVKSNLLASIPKDAYLASIDYIQKVLLSHNLTIQDLGFNVDIINLSICPKKTSKDVLETLENKNILPTIYRQDFSNLCKLIKKIFSKEEYSKLLTDYQFNITPITVSY